MTTKKSRPKNISNSRARYDYALGDEFVVGLELTGAETKSLRKGQAHLRGAYVTIKDDELWLLNATITGDNNIRVPETEQARTRKLLAKRREIKQLAAAKQQGLTIVPLEILNHGRFIKLRIAAGRGRRKYDKREVIKKRDQERTNQAELKYR